MEEKVTSVKISEATGEVKYIESITDTTPKRVRKDRTLDEFIRNQEISDDCWSKQSHYIICSFLIGSGTDMFPSIVRLCLGLSGGSVILLLWLFSFTFGLPLLYMESFLGRYSRLSNCQMYRMAPIFFGLFALLFLFNLSYQCLYATENTQILVNFLKLIVNPDINTKCLDDSKECYDYKIHGPINDKCKYGYISMVCEKHGIIRYPMQYYFWKMYKDPNSDIFPTWQSIIAAVIIWGFILVIVIKKLSSIGSVVYGAFLVQTITLTGLFLSTLTTNGSFSGLQLLFQFNVTNFNIYEVLMIFWYSICRLGLVVPTGFMTSSAYVSFKSKIATECTVIVFFSLLLCLYNLIVFFSIAGVLANAMKVPVESVIVAHRGLYLAMIPEMIVYLQIPNMILVIYYCSLWFFEISKVALFVHLLILNLYDYFPTFKTFSNYIWVTSCVFFCIACMVMCNRSAFTSGLPESWLVYLMFGCGLGVTLESIMVSYFYGVSRLYDDIFFMTGQKPISFWSAMWYSIPILGLTGIIIMCFKRTPTTLEIDTIEIPGSISMFYKIIICTACLLVAIALSIMYIIFRFGLPNLLISLLKPQYYWGPPDKSQGMNRKIFNARFIVRSQSHFQNIETDISFDEGDTSILSDISKEVIQSKPIQENIGEDKFFECIGLYNLTRERYNDIPSILRNEIYQRDVRS